MNNVADINYTLEGGAQIIYLDKYRHISSKYIPGFGSENCGVLALFDFNGDYGLNEYNKSGSIRSFDITLVDLNRRYRYLKKTGQLLTEKEKQDEQNRLERESRPVTL
jgi:hypothetical protein